MLNQEPSVQENDGRITQDIMFIPISMLNIDQEYDILSTLCEHHCVMVTDSDSNILGELTHNS